MADGEVLFGVDATAGGDDFLIVMSRPGPGHHWRVEHTLGGTSDTDRMVRELIGRHCDLPESSTGLLPALTRADNQAPTDDRPLADLVQDWMAEFMGAEFTLDAEQLDWLRRAYADGEVTHHWRDRPRAWSSGLAERWYW